MGDLRSDLSNEAQDLLILADALGRVVIVVDETGRIVARSQQATRMEIGWGEPRRADRLRSALDGSNWRVSDRTRLGDGQRALMLRRQLTQPLEVRLIGGVQIVATSQQRTIDEGPAVKRPWACLLHVVLERQPVARAVVQDALWPGYSETSQRENLATQLRRLTRAAAEYADADAPVISDRGLLRLNPDVVTVDVCRLHAAATRARDLYRNGEEQRGMLLASLAFDEFVLDAGVGGGLFSETDMEAIPALRRLRQNCAGWMADLTEMAFSYDRSAGRQRAWSMLRSAWAYGKPPEEVLMRIIRSLAGDGQLTAARVMYEDVYARDTETPVSWDAAVSGV